MATIKKKVARLTIEVKRVMGCEIGVAKKIAKALLGERPEFGYEWFLEQHFGRGEGHKCGDCGDYHVLTYNGLKENSGALVRHDGFLRLYPKDSREPVAIPR